MDLALLWFGIVGFLFIGYFVLDGFDFGVGMSMPFLAKDDTDKRLLINTIGPVWDLNETWLIVAGASLFAAFPYWYATLFDGFYLALLLILLALIARGVSFEYRRLGKSPRWKAWFDGMIVVGSAVPALLWGVAFANIVQGVAIDETGTYTGSLFDLLNVYAILGVSCDFSPDELRRAYRAASRECHPDKGGSQDDFTRVARAHEVLSDANQLEDLTAMAFSLDASWVLTGEDKVEDLSPRRPLYSFGELGPGAWEIALRYEHVRADSDAIDLGFAEGSDRLDSVTTTVNWYLLQGVRLGLSVVYSRFGDDIGPNLDQDDEIVILSRFGVHF